MKEAKLIPGMFVKMTEEFMIKHVRIGDTRLRYADKYEKRYYGIVGESLDNRVDYIGNRHYVNFYDIDNQFIEKIGIHYEWLDEFDPETLLYTIDKIIDNLNKLENKLKQK